MGDAVKLHQPCLDCGSHDALTYYDDGSSYCFSCNTYRKGTVKEIRYMDEISLEENKWDELKPEAGVFSDIPDRKLTEATCKKFGVKVIKNSSGIAQHIYPYYDKDNHLLCQKVRTVSGKSFHVLNGSQMKNALLFGQNVFPASGKYITVCEDLNVVLAIYRAETVSIEIYVCVEYLATESDLVLLLVVSVRELRSVVAAESDLVRCLIVIESYLECALYKFFPLFLVSILCFASYIDIDKAAAMESLAQCSICLNKFC